jgi:3-oxoacyl-ACP reductase-like protein
MSANANMAEAPASAPAVAPVPAPAAAPAPAPAASPNKSKNASPTRKVKRKSPHDKRIDAMVSDAQECLRKIRFYTLRRNKIIEKLKRLAASKEVNAELAEMKLKRIKNDKVFGSLIKGFGSKMRFGK